MKKEKDLPYYCAIKVSDVILPQLECLNGVLMETELNRMNTEITFYASQIPPTRFNWDMANLNLKKKRRKYSCKQR